MDPNLIAATAFFGVMAFGLGLYVLTAAGTAERRMRLRLQRFRVRFSTSQEAKREARLRSIVATGPQGRFDQVLLGLIPRPDELRRRLNQTGRSISLTQYAGASAALALVVAGYGWVGAGLPLSLCLLLGIIAGIGVPHIVVSQMIRKRMETFLKKFPDAIELMVRGLRSGLPITESINAVGREIGPPVSPEFRQIMDEMRLGRSLDAAMWRAVERIPLPDFKFFVISLAIQRETGGNLAETLQNLADILRKRQQMKLKVRALSAEGKASAMILGSLPFIMVGLLLMLNYDYISTLWTDPRAQLASIIGMVWLGLGFFIISRMIDLKI